MLFEVAPNLNFRVYDICANGSAIYVPTRCDHNEQRMKARFRLTLRAKCSFVVVVVCTDIMRCTFSAGVLVLLSRGVTTELAQLRQMVELQDYTYVHIHTVTLTLTLPRPRNSM